MSIDVIFEQAGIPLILFLVCVYYGLRLIILHDVKAIRGKDKPPVRDEEKYATSAGKLMLFLGVVSLGMGILSFVNVYLAMAELVVGIVILLFLWKRMEQKYGA